MYRLSILLFVVAALAGVAMAVMHFRGKTPPRPALGGFALLSFHLRCRALPSGLVVEHGLLAVAGFVVLVAAEYVLISG
jgi:hypothetical protein